MSDHLFVNLFVSCDPKMMTPLPSQRFPSYIELLDHAPGCWSVVGGWAARRVGGEIFYVLIRLRCPAYPAQKYLPQLDTTNSPQSFSFFLPYGNRDCQASKGSDKHVTVDDADVY